MNEFRTVTVVVGVGLAGLGAGVLARRAMRRNTLDIRRGIATNGMEYTVMGDGPRQLLFIPGGPGSEAGGMEGRLSVGQLAAYVPAGYTVWIVTRRRNMPADHSMADMAGDHADFIRDHLGGRADLVIGTSYGGLVLLYLAANHPALVDRAVLCYSAATVADVGKDIDLRLARARSEGRFATAAAIMLEFFLPSDRWAPLRPALGRLLGPLVARSTVPAGDLLVEANAEESYDGREVATRLESPVLLLAGEADVFFPPDIVEETAALIPDCTVIRYPGGHAGALSSRIAPDVLAWISDHEESASVTGSSEPR